MPSPKAIENCVGPFQPPSPYHFIHAPLLDKEMPELQPQFEKLVPPSRNGSEGKKFSAVPIPAHPFHRVACDERGDPYLLLAVKAPETAFGPTTIRLEHLIVQHGVRCRIAHPDDGHDEGVFTIIGCLNGSRALHAYFFRIMESLLPLVEAQASAEQVSSSIQHLVELFNRLTQPPRKPVQGLWAELLLIAASTNIEAMMDAWHPSQELLYDFNAGSKRIEVKSATSRIRRHHFRLEQLHPPQGTDLLIASFLVEPSGAGVSIASLMQQIRSPLASRPDLVQRLELMVASTLGDGWRRGMDARFDHELATESLCFYRPENIPRLGREIPPHVSEVRFLADLTDAATVESRAISEAGGLFAATLPRRRK